MPFSEQLNRAIEEDIAGRVMQAADLYEQVISAQDAPQEAFVNLAVLYWDCTDPGFPINDLSFILRCGQRYSEVLQEASRKFSDDCEIRFWILYCDFISLGGPMFREECKSLITSSCNSLVPYFYLYGFPDASDLPEYRRRILDGLEFEMQASLLLAQCKGLPTTKNRYILSIIESTKNSINMEVKASQLST